VTFVKIDAIILAIEGALNSAVNNDEGDFAEGYCAALSDLREWLQSEAAIEEAQQ